MRSLLLALCLLLFPPLAGAWNAAGHRLAATIAWQQLSPATREFVSAALARHPDHARWVDRARSSEPAAIFAEAATWPDDIRNDPRFFDETRDKATELLPGFPDMGRHKRWHYVDVGKRGRVVDGEADRQIERLSRLLRSTGKNGQNRNAWPSYPHGLARRNRRQVSQGPTRATLPSRLQALPQASAGWSAKRSSTSPNSQGLRAPMPKPSRERSE